MRYLLSLCCSLFLVNGYAQYVALPPLATSSGISATPMPLNEASSVPSWQQAVLSHIELLSKQASIWEMDTAGNTEVAVPKILLRKTSQGQYVGLLCEALKIRGFGECTHGLVITSAEEELIKNAQDYYGLSADGLADTQLYNALSLKTSEKALLAREAITELTSQLQHAEALKAKRAIFVNVPSFSLKAYDSSTDVFESKVIVGRTDRQTPLKLLNLISLKFNPNWTPPPGIMKKDVYPALDKGSNWIQKHGLIMYDANHERVDPTGVTSEMAKRMGYTFSQPAGKSAALGLLKFETDSIENIYLHDTNQRSLFKQSMRAHSSGCIRVQQWAELASWLWRKPVEEVTSVVRKGQTQWQKVETTPVFLGYRQVDVVAGRVVVYPDIYSKRIRG